MIFTIVFSMCMYIWEVWFLVCGIKLANWHNIFFLLIIIFVSISAEDTYYYYRPFANSFPRNAIVNRPKTTTTTMQHQKNGFQKNLICKCGRQFGCPNTYKYHSTAECGRRFACSICPSVLSTRSNLTKHMKNVHKIH